MVVKFTEDLNSGRAVRGLLCLGELGRITDLSSHAVLMPTIVSSFDSPDEETRSAASFALGNIAAGNLSAFVPHLLKVAKSRG